MTETQTQPRNLDRSTTVCCEPSCCGGGAAEVTTASAPVEVNLPRIDDAQLKEAIRRRYAAAARAASQGTDPRCGCGCTAEVKSLIGAGAYGAEEAAVSERAVQASLGCSNPILLADLAPGEVVLDLGSGGGLDVLLSARRVAPGGRAIGLDMTDEMLELARHNQREAGVENAEFLKGEMEDIPLPDGAVDVVVSNCVVNLSPDKGQVLREAYRVLRGGGRLAIADVVRTGELPPKLLERLDLWSACLAGALDVHRYEELLAAAGFADASIEVLHTYNPGDLGEAVAPLLEQLGLSPEQANGLFASASVQAVKPRC